MKIAKTAAPPPGALDKQIDAARRRAGAKLAWWRHAGLFAAGNAVLAGMDAAFTPGWWFYWPLLAWGLGLGFHRWAVVRGGARSAPGD